MELMPSESKIGRLLVDLRVDRGLTQRRLAELAGTNHTYLSKIENGRLGTVPSVRLLTALADVLEVVHGLYDCFGFDTTEVEAHRKAKQEKRGGFLQGVILEKVIEGP